MIRRFICFQKDFPVFQPRFPFRMLTKKSVRHARLLIYAARKNPPRNCCSAGREEEAKKKKKVNAINVCNLLNGGLVFSLLLLQAAAWDSNGTNERREKCEGKIDGILKIREKGMKSVQGRIYECVIFFYFFIKFHF